MNDNNNTLESPSFQSLHNPQAWNIPIDVSSQSSTQESLTAVSNSLSHIQHIITGLEKSHQHSKSIALSEQKQLLQRLQEMKRKLSDDMETRPVEELKAQLRALVDEGSVSKQLKERLERLSRLKYAQQCVQYLHSLSQEKKKALHYVQEGDLEKAITSYHDMCDTSFHFFKSHHILYDPSNPKSKATSSPTSNPSSRPLNNSDLNSHITEHDEQSMTSNQLLDYFESRFGSFSGHFYDASWEVFSAVLKAMKEKSDVVLEALKWPKSFPLGTASLQLEFEALYDLARFSLTFFEPYDELQLRDEHLFSSSPSPQKFFSETFPLFSILLAPIERAFRFHFYGSRPTNRLEKPEFFLTYILNIIRDLLDDGFFEEWLQGVFLDICKDTTKRPNIVLLLKSIDPLSEFLSGLVRLVEDKVTSIAPSLSKNPSLFLHTVNELCLFDTKLVQTYSFNPRIVKHQTISSPSPSRSTIDSSSSPPRPISPRQIDVILRDRQYWKGTLGSLLSSPHILSQWLEWESETIATWFDEHLTSSVSNATTSEFSSRTAENNNPFQLYLSGTGYDSDSIVLKHTRLAESLTTLLQSQTSRLEMIVFPSWQIQFFIKGHVRLFERFLDVMKVLLERSIKSPVWYDTKSLEIFGGIPDGRGSDRYGHDEIVSNLSRVILDHPLFDFNSTSPNTVSVSSQVVRVLFPISTTISSLSNTTPRMTKNVTSSSYQDHFDTLSLPYEDKDPLITFGRLCRCASSLLFLIKWMQEASQEDLYIRLSEWITPSDPVSFINPSVFDEIIVSYEALLGLHMTFLTQLVGAKFGLRVQEQQQLPKTELSNVTMDTWARRLVFLVPEPTEQSVNRLDIPADPYRVKKLLESFQNSVWMSVLKSNLETELLRMHFGACL